MSTEKQIVERAGNKCELCSSETDLGVYLVEPVTNIYEDDNILICGNCKNQIENPDAVDVNHWRCLNDSMWSTVKPVQIMAYRMLHQLKAEGWPQDLLDMLYLEDDVKERAEELISDDEGKDFHKDCNGVRLEKGDSVVLIKDLNVKGTGFTAKRGTAVRNINLDLDDVTHIEGRVNGQMIVILTQYVKKT